MSKEVIYTCTTHELTYIPVFLTSDEVCLIKKQHYTRIIRESTMIKYTTLHLTVLSGSHWRFLKMTLLTIDSRPGLEALFNIAKSLFFVKRLIFKVLLENGRI